MNDPYRSRLGTLLGLGALLLAGCGAETAGESIEFRAVAAAVVAPQAGASARSFTTERGWDIELDAARVLVGPIHFHGGGQRASLWQRVFGPSLAYAHPSDATFDQGPPLGDVLEQYVVDLLSPTPTSLGMVYGLKGELLTFELQLHPPGISIPGSSEAEVRSMGEGSFVLEGRARRGETEVEFAAHGDLSEVSAERAITSIDAQLKLADRRDQPGALVIEIHVDDWFRQVDFEPEDPVDDRGRTRFPLGSRVGGALRWGIGSKFSYTAQWRHP